MFAKQARRAVFALALLASFPARAADQALIDAAKKEGSVYWYTTAIVDQFVRPAIAAFEAKYGVKVEYYRASPPDLVQRVVNEARAGRMAADLVDGTTTSVELRKADLVEKWVPAIKIDPRYVDPEGYWMACNEYVLTPGVNTDLVAKGAGPRTWNDLLDPKWKGKMAWASTAVASGGAGFIGLVLAELGEDKGRDFLRKLGAQEIHGLKVTARQVLDQVIAGEYPLALQIFNNHAPISKARGAPVDWLRMEPALRVNLTMSATKGSPHPNAGKLLFDFIMSDEGQAIMAKSGELPVAPNVQPLEPELRPENGRFRAIYIAPDKLQAGMPGWVKIFDEFFR